MTYGDPEYQLSEFIDKRLRYFYGQFLQAQDFVDEQNYHRGHRRHHLHFFHSPGIVAGLDVTISGSVATVKSGIAIDGDGNLIVLADDQNADIPTDEDNNYLLTIVYQEIVANKLETDSIDGDYPRWHEKPLIELYTEEDWVSMSNRPIRLEKFSVVGSTITKSEENVRVYAGFQLPGGPELKSGQSEQAELYGDLEVSGNARINSGTLKIEAPDKTDALLTLGNGKNQDLLEFKTENGWKFTSADSEENTSLDLQALESGKSFRVISCDGEHVPLEVFFPGSEKENVVLLVQDDGNVGIGMINPDNKLDVMGDIATRSGGAVRIYKPDDGSYAVLKLDENQTLQLCATGSDGQLNIDKDGNVGIGTTTPSEKLEIDGVIRATAFEGDGSRLSGIQVANWLEGDNGEFYFIGNKVGIGTKKPLTRLHITGEKDVGDEDLSQRVQDHGRMMIGRISGRNLVFDDNEIMARNKFNESPLHLQADGGDLVIHYHQDGQSPNRRFVIKDSGNVGIGVKDPGTNKLDVRGTCYSSGGWQISNADYAEYFQSSDDRKIPVGTSVTLDNGKIRRCGKKEKPIGIISANPGLVGGYHKEWHKKYLCDEFGRPIIEKVKEEILIPRKNSDGTDFLDDDGLPLMVGSGKYKTYRRQKLNPEYDESQEYIPRDQRREWNCVGLLGQLPLRKSQPVAETWVKIKNISDEVELWLVK
ncbi:MAG: hypothetical protein JEZ06_08040 [Anaerolineaceae bacterium]|nr:hypothetical protein [Anaerolineaceae bacterium]